MKIQKRKPFFKIEKKKNVKSKKVKNQKKTRKNVKCKKIKNKEVKK